MARTGAASCCFAWLMLENVEIGLMSAGRLHVRWRTLHGQVGRGQELVPRVMLPQNSRMPVQLHMWNWKQFAACGHEICVPKMIFDCRGVNRLSKSSYGWGLKSCTCGWVFGCRMILSQPSLQWMRWRKLPASVAVRWWWCAPEGAANVQSKLCNIQWCILKIRTLNIHCLPT